MSAKILSPTKAAALVKDGDSIMVGGFLAYGSPNSILEEISKSGTQNLTAISNDAAYPGQGLGKLIETRQISKLLVTHIGKNPEAGEQMTQGEIEVELIPQGTMAERIRCGGFGLGGFLTPTGVGTPVEEGKSLVTIANKRYLLETPLKANVALIKAHKADQRGNLTYHRVARNFNPVMATAADIVIAEVEEIVENGSIDPDNIITPSIFIDYLVINSTEAK